jgi:hypothetical protein
VEVRTRLARPAPGARNGWRPTRPSPDFFLLECAVAIRRFLRIVRPDGAPGSSVSSQHPCPALGASLLMHRPRFPAAPETQKPRLAGLPFRVSDGTRTRDRLDHKVLEGDTDGPIPRSYAGLDPDGPGSIWTDWYPNWYPAPAPRRHRGRRNRCSTDSSSMHRGHAQGQEPSPAGTRRAGVAPPEGLYRVRFCSKPILAPVRRP